MRRTALLAAALAAAFTAGCVEYEEHIDLHPDGSGTMRVVYSAPPDVDIHFGDVDLSEGDEDDIRREVEKRYTSNRVRLCSLKVVEHEPSRRVVDFVVEFEDVEALGELRAFGWESRVDFQRHGDELEVKRIIRVDTDGDWDEESDSAFEAWVKKQIAENVLSKVRFRWEWVFPHQVEETNATWVRGKRVAVWRYSLADVVGHRRLVQYAVGK